MSTKFSVNSVDCVVICCLVVVLEFKLHHNHNKLKSIKRKKNAGEIHGFPVSYQLSEVRICAHVAMVLPLLVTVVLNQKLGGNAGNS